MVICERVGRGFRTWFEPASTRRGGLFRCDVPLTLREVAGALVPPAPWEGLAAIVGMRRALDPDWLT